MSKPFLITASLLFAGLAIAVLTLTTTALQPEVSSAGSTTTTKTPMAATVSEATAKQATPIGNNQNSAGPLDQMAVKLAQRLEQQPDDADGWVLLGKTYQFMGNEQAAEQSYQRAAQLGYDQSKLDQIRSDMQAAPQPTKPQRLLPEPKPSKNLTAVMIKQAIENGTGEKANAAISGSISLAPDLQPLLQQGNATLFIFARREQGPPRPLAAIRKVSPQFPFSFTLNDSHSIMGDQKLSGADAVIVGARISFSGNATPVKGDLEGFSGTVKTTGSEPQAIEINQVRK